MRDAQTGETLFTQEHPGEMLRGVYAIDGGRRLLLQHGVKSVDEGQVQPLDYCSVWTGPCKTAADVVLSLPGLMSCAPSPDGESLAVLHHAGGAQYLSVYALADGSCLARCPWSGRRYGQRLALAAEAAARWDASARASCTLYGWPGLGVLAQEDFIYPCALDFLPASPLAAIGSWEAGMLMELNLHKRAA